MNLSRASPLGPPAPPRSSTVTPTTRRALTEESGPVSFKGLRRADASDPMALAAHTLSSRAQRELILVLSRAYGSERRALRVLGGALESSFSIALPTHGRALVEFVERDLVPILTADLGPLLTLSMMQEVEALRTLDDDATARQPPGTVARWVPNETRSGPRRLGFNETIVVPAAAIRRTPSSILLVDAEPLGRSNWARALIRRAYSVRAVGSPRDLNDALLHEADFRLAIVDLDHRASAVIVNMLATRRPLLPLLARTFDRRAGRAMLEAHRIASYSFCERSASVETIAAITAELPCAPPPRG